MTDLDQLLARIDATLADCTAPLPPLPAKPPAADPTSWPEPRLVEDQALVQASPTRRSDLFTVTETGPEPVIQIADPNPASWWRRILGRQW